MVRIVHGTNSPRGYEQSTVRTVQEGTNSPRYEQSRVRKVQRRYESCIYCVYYNRSRLLNINGPWYEQFKRVRTVHSTNSPGGYEQSTVRTVQGTNSPSVVRIVQSTKSPGTAAPIVYTLHPSLIGYHCRTSSSLLSSLN